MFMRFRVQYYDVRGEKWHNVGKTGDSGFLEAGRSSVKARQSGVIYRFPHDAGQVFQLRGKVTFEWRTQRKAGKVVRRAMRMTTAGHHSSAGSDPEGYSSDTCVIS
jgi:hypothetical protein